MKLRGEMAGCLVVFIWGAAAFGQGKPPASEVQEPYRDKFVRYADGRSMKEKVLNSIGLTSQDVGRSFALIAGVSKYPNMTELQRDLPPAAADIDELQEYLKNQEFFDEIVVLRDGDVTLDNFTYFLQDYFPKRLKQSPKARFLFAYSGHGITVGSKDNPTGYLLKSTARDFDDVQNSINMSVLRVYIDQIIESGYQTLVLINACHSGAFLSRRAFGNIPGLNTAGGIYFPKNAGAHAIMAGGSEQLTWHDPKFGKGSIFFEKLLAGLGGQADTFPVYPDGHRGDGIITVDEIATYLREEVSLATNQAQIPIPADLAPNRSLGGFFFLNRQRVTAQGAVPAWNPSHATQFGISAEETSISAKEHFEHKEYPVAFSLFRKSAEQGDASAAYYVGYMYEHALGIGQDYGQAVIWFRKGLEAGDVRAMNSLGVMYAEGHGGLPKDDAQAVNWFRKAADAGDAKAMNNIGECYKSGRGGLPKDDGQAVNWFRKAADAGDARAMNNVGAAYKGGHGGLPKDDGQAVNWFRKAADAGNVNAMGNLGEMYAEGRGGLPKDDGQAVNWFRKAAEGGDAYGMSHLGECYEFGRGGLPKDDIQALFWFRKSAWAGNPTGMSHLGYFYASGRGGSPNDDVQAVSWYRKAADAGDAAGMRHLGFMYLQGRGGLPKDRSQAVDWYQRAAQAGDIKAQQALVELRK